MKKGLLLIMALLLALCMLSGCNLIGYDAELDGAQIVAKVNDHEITKAEWLSYRDYLVAYEQQYMQQNYGFTMPVNEETLASYSDAAIEQMVESYVVEDKAASLGLDQLNEEEAKEAEDYAKSMSEFYKMMLRYQNYPQIETVEEEAERLASAETAEGEEPATPVATVTDAELDEMLNKDLEAVGYTYEYFYQNEVATRKQEKIREHATADVAVTDEETKAEFDRQVETQKASFDATPSMYMTYQNAGYPTYYVPAGYRGVKHVLVKIDDAKQTEMTALSSTVSTATTTITNVSEQLEELKAADISAYDETAKAEYNEQIAALEAQLAQAQTDKDDAQGKLDALSTEAFAEILPIAQEVQTKALADEDFDGLVAAYGEDPGMTSEPAKTQGYMVCEGLAVYEQAFQDAAMALENVGDITAEPVKTSYGYHIMQYTGGIKAGAVEFTDEIKTTIHDELLVTAQDAAYEAAVTEWVSQAKVETFPKIMK